MLRCVDGSPTLQATEVEQKLCEYPNEAAFVCRLKNKDDGTMFSRELRVNVSTEEHFEVQMVGYG